MPLHSENLLVDVAYLARCGLFDIARRWVATGQPVLCLLGMDRDHPSGRMARDLAEAGARSWQVSFQDANASVSPEPLASQGVTVWVARLLLSYERVCEAFIGMVRAIRLGGLVLLQVHAPCYYRRCFLHHLTRLTMALYYLRPLLAGGWMRCMGRQCTHRWFQETSLTPQRIRSLMDSLRGHQIWRGGFADKPLLVLQRMTFG